MMEGEATTDLSSMTKAELLAYAEEHEISGVSSSQTKAVIIQKIMESESNA